MSVQTPATVLVIMARKRYPLRSNHVRHLRAFETLPGVRVVYLNLAWEAPPPRLGDIPFDLVVLDKTFFYSRFKGRLAGAVEQLTPLRERWPAPWVALPQDEYFRCDDLAEAMNALKVKVVFSCLPDHTWPVIYRRIDTRQTQLFQVLTGYLDEHLLAHCQNRPPAARPTDIGYRVGYPPPWLGRHGLMKYTLGERVLQLAPALGLKTDISLHARDMIVGNAWYDFLLGCNYAIGNEGGASLVDFDGSVRQRVDAFVKQHPAATFDAIEAACFPGQDNQVRAFALSPRHLECCVTRTAQVLVEGDYNGILQPWRHYLPVRPDLSNLQEMLQMVREDALREDITRHAWEDVVASGHYGYPQFARLVLEKSLGAALPAQDRRTSAQNALVDQFQARHQQQVARSRRRALWQDRLKAWLRGRWGQPSGQMA